MATFCPPCDEEIEDALHQEWDYSGHFDFECPKCKKEMEVTVEMEPCFSAYKKLEDKNEQ